jgi:hypothetical protein
VLGASGPAALWDVFVRRTTLAAHAFARGLMPLATLVAIGALVAGWRRRERVLAAVHGMPAWPAALAGGAVGGIAGALANDSGPVLLVLATVGVVAGAAYLRPDPDAPSRGSARGVGSADAGRARLPVLVDVPGGSDPARRGPGR